MSILGLTNILSNSKHESFFPLRPANPNNKWNAICVVDFRISAKTKDYEVQLTHSGSNTKGGFGQFSAPVKPSNPKHNKEDEERQKYYVNMGYAIRTIREDFPALFYRELCFDIFRDDIVFKDPMNTFVGIENYKSIFWALRFHGRIFFRALWIDIVSVWQPMEGVIMVRWTIHGVPRVPWESRCRFDGTSEYKLDKGGKIYEHKVHNIAMNSPPKFQVMGVEELIQSFSCPSTPKPTCFEISSSKFDQFMDYFTMYKHSSESFSSVYCIHEPETSHDS
ncbi:hypothetical protein V2J09_002389 [Rumex salicifolius]